MKHFLAIDPGASGGLAWNSFVELSCDKMPKTEKEIVNLICGLTFERPTVVLEQVGGFIGKGQPGSSMFSFGENFGLIKGIVLTLGLELITVTPQRWQRATIPGKKKDFNYEAVLSKGKRKGQVVIKNSWKENLCNHASAMFPDLQVTKQTADALLILNYAIKNL